MLSGLQLLSQFLGYFNIKDKPKNRAITVIAFIVNFYLLYIAIDNLRYAGYRWQGFWYLLAFLVLEYFLILNFIYYFTDKTVKFDISPYVEKALGGNPNAATSDEPLFNQNIPSSGLFDQKHILPAELSVNAIQQHNIDELAQLLERKGYLHLNYSGLSDRELYKKAAKMHEPILAMSKPLQLPFYELREDAYTHQLIVYAGMNSMTAKPVGTITKIGFTNIDMAKPQYQFALANAYLSGGPFKRAGRNHMVAEQRPFEVLVRVAYEDINGNVNNTIPRNDQTSMVDHLNHSAAPVSRQNSHDNDTYRF